MQIRFANDSLQRLMFIFKDLISKGIICNVAAFTKSTGEITKSYILNVMIRAPHPKSAQKLLDAMNDHQVFCRSNKICDKILRRIFWLYFGKYCADNPNQKSEHVGEIISVGGINTVSAWNPRLDKRCYEYGRALDKDRKVLLERLAKIDMCYMHPLAQGLQVLVIPSNAAKTKQCIRLKGILDKLTPDNPDWIVKCRNDQAYCYVKYKTVEEGEKIFEELQVLDGKQGKIMIEGTKGIKSTHLTLGHMWKIKIKKMQMKGKPDEKYIVVEDSFVMNQIELRGLMAIHSR